MENNNFKLTVPVLLIGFNRPDIIRQSLSYIRNAKPQKLYVAIDGPRKDKKGEEKLVNEVKQIVKNIDWPCETKYKFNETNKGAEITISSAIFWVLDLEEYAIILEDDIIAPLSFFKFAQEMLLKYKNEEKICMISGCNFTPMKTSKKGDYFFSKYGHTWGWATWRRAWDKFDLYTSIDKENIKYKNLRKLCESRAETKHFRKKYRGMMQRGRGNSAWDAYWGYIYRTNNLLSIVPKVNLTSNIGTYGLHTNGSTDLHFRPYEKNFIVKNHPPIIEKNVEYDQYHFQNYINKSKSSLTKRLLKKIKTYINKFFKIRIIHIY